MQYIKASIFYSRPTYLGREKLYRLLSLQTIYRVIPASLESLSSPLISYALSVTIQIVHAIAETIFIAILVLLLL